MRKKWPEGGCRTPPSPFVNETSLWLLERGLCDPETAAEYVGRKLLSPEAFAQARKEYQRATGNSSDRRRYHSSFAARKQMLKVRVAFCDAPEMGQAFGQRAKQLSAA